MKKILCFFISFITLFTIVFPLSAFATSTDEQPLTTLDDTSVEDDLKFSYIDLNNTFPLNDSDKGMYLISFMEQGYNELSGIDGDFYGLYLYVYNPSGKDLFGDINKVQFGIKWTKDNSGVIKVLDYAKYGISIVNANSNNTLIKFKVNNPDLKIMLRYDNMRRYDISGFEVQRESLGNFNDFTVGTSYTFSGYAKGFSTESKNKSTLACVCDQLTTISVDVHQVSYLTGNSSLGVGYSNQINSVYFSLPNDIEKEYGDLYSIKYEYNHYYTSPIIVTDNVDSYQKIYGDLGVKKDAEDFDYGIRNYEKITTSQVGVYDYIFHFVYGYPYIDDRYAIRDFTDERTFIPEYLTSVFLNTDHVGDWGYGDVLVKSEDLDAYFKNYNASYHTGKELGYSADLFDLSKSNKYVVETKNINDRFSLAGYADSKDYNAFLRWINYGFVDKEDLEGIKNAKYIEKITPSMILSIDNFEKEFLMDDIYQDEFLNFYTGASVNGDSVYLLRYAYAPDYYSLVCNGYNIDGNFLMAQGNAYLKFDIIQFSFMDHKGNETIIPVVSDPANGSFNVTVTDPDRDFSDFIKDVVDGKGNDDPEFNLLLIAILFVVIAIVLITVFVLCCIYLPGFGSGVLSLLLSLKDLAVSRLKYYYDIGKTKTKEFFDSSQKKLKQSFNKKKRYKRSSRGGSGRYKKYRGKRGYKRKRYYKKS